MSHTESVVDKLNRTARSMVPIRPTHVRWSMVSLVTIIMIVDSVDRASLGIAGKYIQDEFAFSTQTMGVVLSAFTWGYALFQLPWGYAGDRYGPRDVLTLAVVWAAVFTAAAGLVPQLHQLHLTAWLSLAGSFCVMRFLAGVGVAAAAPNGNKIAALWMSKGERGFGSSFISIGSGTGHTLAPILITFVMLRWGWRASFYVCGALGVVMAAAWKFYATNRPEDHPRVNAEELAYIRAGEGPTAPGLRGGKSRAGRPPWKQILSSTSVWSLILGYACQGYAVYIFFNWFFIYLVRVRGLTLSQGGWWGATPFIAMTVMAPVGGWVSDRAVRRFGRRRGRQTSAWLGMGLSAVFLWAGGHTANYTLAIPLLALAAGFNFFAVASWWATCIDLAPSYSGSLSGLMNTCGNLGGAVSPILTAFIATRFGWTQALDFAALVTVAGGLLWLLTDAGEALEKPA